jgi:hypothetical protein
MMVCVALAGWLQSSLYMCICTGASMMSQMSLKECSLQKMKVYSIAGFGIALSRLEVWFRCLRGRFT